MLKHTVLYLSIAMLASGVVPAAEDARPIPWRLEPVKTIKGCKVPECVVVDSENALAYISNVEALPDEYWSDDGRGFISLMTVDGKMLKRRWLNSEPGALIHGPKGMCLLKDVLYIADNSRLLARPLQPGGQLEVLSVPGAQRINDLATEGTHVFASDTTRGVIYKVNPVSGEVAVLKSPPSVNGITFHKGAFFAVSWDLHDIFEIDLSGEADPVPFGLGAHFTHLDGIEVLDDGTFIVSDFDGNAIWAVGADRKAIAPLANVETPADIGLDRKRMLLYVPLFMKDEVAIFRLKKEPAAE
ncbi:MAG: SMP-30/gluconolactonase/LRE family protein [Candidatus Hydrogenedentales bacterium]|jgi:hypothetical protein